MDGELRTGNGETQLVFVRTLGHPREKVWRALTEPEHAATWFPADIEGERVAGAPLRFSFRFAEVPPIDGRMIAYEPPSLLEFSWGEGETVRFELEANGSSTRLTLINTIKQLGKAARDGAGWHACLDALDAHLDGKEPASSPAERAEQLRNSYMARFGPEASTIGPPVEARQ